MFELPGSVPITLKEGPRAWWDGSLAVEPFFGGHMITSILLVLAALVYLTVCGFMAFCMVGRIGASWQKKAVAALISPFMVVVFPLYLLGIVNIPGRFNPELA